MSLHWVCNTLERERARRRAGASSRGLRYALLDTQNLAGRRLGF